MTGLVNELLKMNEKARNTEELLEQMEQERLVGVGQAQARENRANSKNKSIRYSIREIPDHATFREKEHILGCLDKLGGFLSLALCNLANFDQL